MYGKTVNQLNVYLGSSKVFSKSGAQGNEWKKAEVSINGQGNVSRPLGVKFWFQTLYEYCVGHTFINLKKW